MINIFTSRHKKEWSGREIDASQAERLGRSCFSIRCSVLSFARSAQAQTLSHYQAFSRQKNYLCIYRRLVWIEKKIRIKTVFDRRIGGHGSAPAESSAKQTLLYHP